MLQGVLLIVLLVLTPNVYADDVPVTNGIAQDHFVWPKESFPFDRNKFGMIKVNLPYLPLDNGPKPSLRCVYYIDLNGDGEKEMIVDLGRDGITEDFVILQRKNDKWQEIGAIIGLSKICAKANGYYQLENYRDYKGGSTECNLFQFIKGRYREVRSEEYERGVLTSVTFDPKGVEDESIIYDKEGGL